MAKDSLPTYALVELLIRLAPINPHIGDYKDHAVYTDAVIVKTTSGHITFPKTLIQQQFDHPELITTAQLQKIALTFKPAGKSSRF